MSTVDKAFVAFVATFITIVLVAFVAFGLPEAIQMWKAALRA